MPSYLRLLTEQPAHIANPPTGHTALYASSGTGGENKYELYIKNPEGFSHPVGMFASGGTVSGNATFNSGVTVYSGGYTMSGGGDAAFVALVVNGTISGLTGPGGNAAGGGIIIQDNLTVSGSAGGVGGTISGTTQILVGSGHTDTSGTFSNAFGKAHNTSGLLSVAFGSANTSTGLGAFTSGRHNTASGVYSFAGGSANTSSGILSNSFGAGHLVSGDLGVAFGTGNSSTAAASFTSGSGTSATTHSSFAAGSATTASGTSHFVVGRGNITSDLFVVGNGTDGNNTTAGGTGAASRNNAFRVGHSGVTILGSAGTLTSDVQIGRASAASVAGSNVAALTIYSGSGSHPLGFMMPSISVAPESVPHPELSGSSKTQDNTGLMFWDGSAIRVYTGGTMWAKVGLVDDAYIAMTGH
jgi:hypothetical protein|tara:strand:+ start:8487 stop:9728 length:1242 start_codon:yes stop_codon:yes gene_type:complete